MVKRLAILAFAILSCTASAWAALPPNPMVDTKLESATRGALLNLGAEFEKKIARGVNLGFEGEIRLKEMTNYAKGVNHLERLEVGPKLTYKVCDYVRLGAGYSYRAYYKDGKESTNWENYWTDRHVGFFEVVGSYKISQWKLSLRLRPELTHRTDSICELEKVRNFCELRTKFQVEYEFREKPIELYAYVEVFNTLNAINPNKTLAAVYAMHDAEVPMEYMTNWSGQYMNDIRSSVGMSYRFDKRNKLKIYYRFYHDIGRSIHLNKNYANNFKEFTITREKEFNHMLGIGYSYSF